MDSKTITARELAALIDHTNLKPFAGEAEYVRLCREAVENGFAMVAINSAPVALCSRLLTGTGVHVGAAISFPLGQTTLPVKLRETENAIENGADEIDYVINIARLKDGDLEYLRREMEEITDMCRAGGVLCKVIFETCYLESGEIVALANIAREVGPDFIKTSTGFGTAGATVEHVRLMKETVGCEVKVKAAGGIRDWAACATMIDAGAERIGTSNGLVILQQFNQLFGF